MLLIKEGKKGLGIKQYYFIILAFFKTLSDTEIHHMFELYLLICLTDSHHSLVFNLLNPRLDLVKVVVRTKENTFLNREGLTYCDN